MSERETPTPMPEPMSEEELRAERATDLPEREALSIIAVGDNVAAPTNEATAINYDSDYSIAVADADQIVFVEQTDSDPAAEALPDAGGSPAAPAAPAVPAPGDPFGSAGAGVAAGAVSDA